MTIADKLTTIVENELKVYEAGKKSEYKAFWDAAEASTDYNYRFCGKSWNDNTFKPQRDIIPLSQANSMFYNSGISDLKEIIKNQNIIFDLSKTISASMLFYQSSVTRLPKIDLSNCNIYRTFYYCTNLVSIDELVIGSGKTIDAEAFYNCTALVEIRIGGVISVNGFDVRWSTKLSAESLDNIVKHTSATVTMTLTLPTTAEATYNAKYGAGAWATLIATRSNVTFAYA